MRINRFALALCVVAVAFVAFAASMSASRAEDAGKTAPLKIGVADLSYIVNNYIRRTDEEGKLQIAINVENERNMQIQNEIKALNARINEMTEQNISSDSMEFINLKNEVELKKLLLKQRVDLTKARVESGKIRILKLIYEDFVKYSRIYAEKQNFDLILSNNPPSLDPAPRDYEMLMLQISVQSIYYYRDSFDLTKALTSYMNEAYNASKTPEAPAPAPAQ